MPHIIVKIAEGRSQYQKEQLANQLTAAATKVLDIDPSAISIAVEDVALENWMQQVYDLDIKTAGDRLIKRPGYGSFAAQKDD